jgi:haloalkane dehalogenase
MLRLPEMIRLLADPNLTPLADAMIDDPNQREWLLGHTGKQFGLDPTNQGGVAAASIIPQFFGAAGSPDALAAIRGWTAALFSMLDLQDGNIAGKRLAALQIPVSLVVARATSTLGPISLAHSRRCSRVPICGWSRTHRIGRSGTSPRSSPA